MNFQKFDLIQSKHPVLAFPIAVIKKYGDDQAGNQAALLTYYGFLALFPLLLVATTILQILAFNNLHFQTDVVNALTGNSSTLGNQLTTHIQSLHRNGLALLVGLLFLLYGARGVASVFRNGSNQVWGITRSHMLGFPNSIIKDITTIVFGGLGLFVAAGITGTVTTYGNSPFWWLLSYIADAIVLYLVFNVLFNLVLVGKIATKEIHLASLFTAIGLVTMQILGAYILGRVLKNLDALYSTFAVSLGLLFWIYLQSQIVYYSMEIALVKSRKLWPIKIIK